MYDEPRAKVPVQPLALSLRGGAWGARRTALSCGCPRAGAECADRINVRHDDANGRHKIHYRPLVARPDIQPYGERNARGEQRVYLEVDLALGDRARRNGSTRLVDGIQVTIIPVVDGLREATEDGSGQQHGEEGFQSVLAYDAPAVGRRVGAKEVPHRVVVSRGCGSTRNAPDEGHPGTRFHELQPDLPVEGHGAIGLGRSAEAEKLADAGARVIVPKLRSLGLTTHDNCGRGAQQRSPNEGVTHAACREEHNEDANP